MDNPRAFWRRITLGARTLSFLKVRQLAYLPVRKVQLQMRPPAVGTDTPGLIMSESLARVVSSWGLRTADSRQRAVQIVEGSFDFLGRNRRLAFVDWRTRYADQLWTFNLHYFDYARDLAWAFRQTGDPAYCDRFVYLASTWAKDTAQTRSDGWHPYVISTRVVNWTYALLLLGDAIPPEQRRALWSSVYNQLCVLEKRIEWHLLANHLQRNLQALALGAMIFDGSQPARWRLRWVPALWSQVQEQVLEDGVHCERSPMYHAIAFADLLETVALAMAVDFPVPSQVFDQLRGMGTAAGVLLRPNGEPHLFNDSATGVAPPLEYLDRLASLVLASPLSRHLGLIELHAGGFYGICGGGARSDRLVIDGGEPGPRYQPGHAHCGLFSFELDIEGRSVITDSGVCGYACHPLREYVRSTRAHNTVSIDGREQHELWGAFRIARRARVENIRQHAGADGGYHFQGTYRPYHSPRIRHRREITYSIAGGRREYSFTDAVDGAEGASLQSFLHLHPRVTVALRKLGATLSVDGISVEVEYFGVDAVEVQMGVTTPRPQGWYCASFGAPIAAPCLVARIAASSGRAFGYRLRVGCP